MKIANINKVILPGHLTERFGIALLTIYLFLFQTGLLTYISSQLQSTPKSISSIIYFTYGASAFLSIFFVIYNQEIRRIALNLLILSLILILPIFLNSSPIDSISKNYIVGIASIFTFTVISCAVGVRLVAQYAIALVCLMSIYCLLDACFLDGFTSTTGRAASIFINPNIAAISLLIGIAGSIWSVKLKWRAAVILLTSGAIYVTLSRTTMIIGLLALLSGMITINRSKIKEIREGLKPAILSFIFVLITITFAYANNKSFGVATKNALQGLISANAMWHENKENTLSPSEESRLKAEIPVSSPNDNVRILPTKPETVTNPTLNDIEHTNSAVARAMLLKQSLDAYKSAPSFGMGLEKAFKLGPHNSFVLFAVAFGHLGWIIIPSLVIFLVLISNSKSCIPSAVAILGASFFSHDILLSVPSVAAIVIVISGAISNSFSLKIQIAHHQKERVILLVAIIPLLLTSIITFNIGNISEKPLNFDINTKDISLHMGNTYYFGIPQHKFSGAIRIEDSRTNTINNQYGVKLFENSHSMISCNSKIEEIVFQGNGKCLYEDRGIVFSTTDNSSPIHNNRKYQLQANMTIHPLLILMVTILFIWSAVWYWAARHSFVLEGHKECAAS